MTWTATTTTTEAGAGALVAELDSDSGLSGLAVDTPEIGPDRWQVVLYFPKKPTNAERAALAALAQSVLGPDHHRSFAVVELPDIDWVAKSLEGLAPVRAGRFLVHGGHDRGEVRPNDIAIEIEAGQAFGTGHHGTTAGCLAAIDRLAKRRRFRNALDVGTGSGVLAIAIAKRLHVPVLASDVDPVAVGIAAGNAKANGCHGAVTAVRATGVDAALFIRRGPFDLIVANILAGPLVRLAPAIRRRAAPGGTVILSGILPGQHGRLVAADGSQDLTLVRSTMTDGWLTLTLADRRGRQSSTR